MIIVGGKYNKWTVLKQIIPSRYNDDLWLCECECGRKRQLTTSRLESYYAHKECYNGCSFCEYPHGNSWKTPRDKNRRKMYARWRNIIGRCCNPNHKLYNYYGGRGIGICDEWRNSFTDFYNYLSSLNGYGQQGLSLDRIDNDKGYFPGNVRWATAKVQANNRRKRSKKNDCKNI